MKQENNAKGRGSERMEAIISLTKRRGFVYQGSEIYGGLAGTWDYGPYGVALRNNIKRLWWKRFVDDREDMYGVDAAILMNQNVWKASGHVAGFSDPLVECKKCNRRYRVDTMITEPDEYKDLLKFVEEKYIPDRLSGVDSKHMEAKSLIEDGQREKKYLDVAKKVLEEAMMDIQSAIEIRKKVELAKNYQGPITQTYLDTHEVCKNCGSKVWGEPRQFNMMFKTHVGAMEDETSISYLRPETAQGMFVNFKNVLDSFHPTLPFGLAQIGKAFRNEIAPRDFIFRLRELEQMEIEYFVKPSEWRVSFEALQKEQVVFLEQDLGLPSSKIHQIDIAPEDRAHYSKHSVDTEFDFPFGQKELLGIAYRTDFDLKNHSEASKVDLSFFDEQTKERYIPHCVEPTFGVDRLTLAVLSDAYTEDELGGEKRIYLKFNPKVAPVKVAVFPLLKNKPQLVEKARAVYAELKKRVQGVEFDDNGNIGKRYRRQDEIGTPFCVTVDFDTVEKDGTVTLRNRDTGAQERLSIEEVIARITAALA